MSERNGADLQSNLNQIQMDIIQLRDIINLPNHTVGYSEAEKKETRSPLF